MIKRELYLKKIRGFYDEVSLIKIIYGLRRSGKSVILNQIMEEVNANKNHIIYLNFESLEFSFIKNAQDLYEYIKKLSKDNGIYYVFIDEIGKIDNFEIAINSLRIMNKFSIFITGSNSRLTFSELSTELSGRYVSFRINPLTFKEAVELTHTKSEQYEELLFDIFEWGSLPQRFSLKSKENCATYISDVYDSILLKDVIERLNIKDITSFKKVMQYILETEGREFSATNVLKYLTSEHHQISSQTLYTYLDALCSVFIVNKIFRYDVVGKATLKTLNKFYASDLGIKKIKTNKKEVNYSTSLENMVYNELVSRDYLVYVGKTTKGEIDFVATKNNSVNYIQVALYLTNEETINREFGAFKAINDSYSRYVISLDKENMSRDGIKHINAIDFLLGKEL